MAIAVLAALLSLSAAQATLPGSEFEGNDGDTAPSTGPDGDQGELDWDNVATVDPAAVVQPDETDPSIDDTLSGSEDDVAPRLTIGSLQDNKANLVGYRVARDGDFLYLAWERRPDPNGNVDYDFELNQAPQPPLPTVDGTTWQLNRTMGDLLFTFELLQGGTLGNLGMLTWLTSESSAASECYSPPAGKRPCWGDYVALNANSDPPAESATDEQEDGTITFGEASINLVDAGIFKADACTNFGSVYVKSRSAGSGFNSQISDVVALTSVTINNCGDLTIVKDSGDTDAEFTFDVDCSDDAFDGEDLPVQTSGGTGQTTIADIPNGTTCTVTEDAKDGWTLDSTSPTGGQVTIDGDTSVTFTNSRDKGKIVDVGTLTVVVKTEGGDGTFTYDVDCDGTLFDAGGSITTAAGSGTSPTIGSIPVATSCTATQAPKPGWTLTSVSPQSVVIEGDHVITFVNTRNANSITVDKSASVTSATEGDAVTFTYVVRSPGPDALGSVSVVDDRCSPVVYRSGDVDEDNLLDPGEFWTYTCQAAATSRAPTNIATATGTDPGGARVEDTDAVTITVVAPQVTVRPAQVQGVQLARTGADIAEWALLGGSLMLLGLSILFVSRQRRSA